jgi:hypothetical protein
MKRFYVIALALLMYAPNLVAQETTERSTERRRPTENPVFEVVPLSNLELDEAAALIKQLEPRVRVSRSESIHAVVLRGDRKSLEDVVGLLNRLEGMASDQGAQRLEILTLHNRNIDEIMDQLLTTVEDSVIAGDEATGKIIVRGPEREIDLVKRLLDELDLPQRTVKLTFYFLLASQHDDEESTSQHLPPKLSGVWEALRRSGAKSATYLGKTEVQCAEAEGFSTRSVQRDETEALRYALEGEVSFTEDADVLRLYVDAEVTHISAAESTSEELRDEFAVESTLAARIGEMVVLASAPAGSLAEASSLVMVVEVSRPEYSTPKR